jgi:hypothetical protein
MKKLREGGNEAVFRGSFQPLQVVFSRSGSAGGIGLPKFGIKTALSEPKRPDKVE